MHSGCIDSCFVCWQLYDAAEPDSCSYVQTVRTTGTEQMYSLSPNTTEMGGRENTDVEKAECGFDVASNKQPPS